MSELLEEELLLLLRQLVQQLGGVAASWGRGDRGWTKQKTHIYCVNIVYFESTKEIVTICVS